MTCAGRQHSHNVDAARCLAGNSQGTSGSTSHGLGPAQFRAGERQARRARAGLRYEGVFFMKGRPLQCFWKETFPEMTPLLPHALPSWR